MAEELQFPSRADNKRKFDDPSPPPPRRPTGFSAPIASSPDAAAPAAAPAAYNNVPPPVDGIELAKQRAQEIVARLFNDAESKRPRVDDDGSGDKEFAPPISDYFQKPQSQQLSPQVGKPSSGTFSSYGGYQGTSSKIEIPNGRVGVIIGKGGETIKYLQAQSGAKIQVTRDSEVVPNSQTRLVELSGTPEQITRAEQLIKDVLAEAESGGSGIGVARRSYGGGEQFSMKVPNDKVGLIIGKGGENIKNMQAQSGARIQLIPLHLPPGDTSTERMVQIDGTAEQIESAKQLVNEVITATRVRNQQMSGGYSQQGYRPPRPPTSWGPPGQTQMQQPGYYMQPGSYPGAPPQYNASQPPYGGYPQAPASGGYPSGWDQSSNPPSQQTPPVTGYDYYNQQQQQQQQPGGGSAPADNTNYNYGQAPNYSSQGSYGDAAYSQPATGQQQQSYGQDNYSAGYYAPVSQPGYSQPTPNSQGGYDNQQGYGSAPTYGAVANPAQDGSAATYGVQSGTTQAPPTQEALPAQPYPNQQGYAGQPPSMTPASYPSQGTAGYGISPTSQPGYGGQPPAQTGYSQSVPPSQQLPQGQKSPSNQAVYGQAQQSTTNQSGYAQPAPVQPGYEQPPAQTGYPGYGTAAQPGYGQQQSYAAAPPSQPGYGQQQQ